MVRFARPGAMGGSRDNRVGYGRPFGIKGGLYRPV